MTSEEVISKMNSIPHCDMAVCFMFGYRSEFDYSVGIINSVERLENDMDALIPKLFDLSIKGYDIDDIRVRSRTSAISKSMSSTLYITVLKNDYMKTNINNDVIETFKDLVSYVDR